MNLKRMSWMSLGALAFVGLITSFSIQAEAADKGDGDKKSDKGKNEGPGSVILLKIDASSLPPAVLQKLLEQAGKAEPKTKVEEKTEVGKGKGKGKSEMFDKSGKAPLTPAKGAITLVEAISRAEKSGQGKAIKAEKKGTTDATYKIELLSQKGEKVKLTLDATGKVITSEKKD